MNQNPNQFAPTGAPNPNMYPGAPAPAGKGLAIASMVLGIVSIVSCWFGIVSIVSCWFGFVSIIALVCSIVAIVLAVMARNKMPVGAPGRGMATAGLVLGIIAVVLSGIAVVCWICLLSAANDIVNAASSYSSWY